MKNNTVLIIGILALAGIGFYLYTKSKQPAAGGGTASNSGGSIGNEIAGIGAGINSAARGITSIFNDFSGNGSAQEA
jgi:LPXTG-motif cell wall-anchored protein